MSKSRRQILPLKNRFKAIFKHPFFWILTIIGNSLILIAGLVLMFFESRAQPTLTSFIDYLLWSAGIVTTIGSAYTPQTLGGKLVTLTLMLLGTLFIWSYMAFLVTGLFTPELAALEREFRDVEKEVRGLKVVLDSDKIESNKL